MDLTNNTGASYDNLMGVVQDAEDHPANNLPEATSSEGNPMNPANEIGQQPMRPVNRIAKPKKFKK